MKNASRTTPKPTRHDPLQSKASKRLTDLQAKRGKLVGDPGNGKRTPAKWGQWLVQGLQRQLLGAMQSKPMYHGTTPRSRTDRAKVKAGRRQRVHQQMAHRGK